MPLCEICKRVRFEELPSEEQPGIPHQPDLYSLEKSAVDCQLCRVIFGAASELSAIIENCRSGNSRKNPGGEVSFSWAPTGSQSTCMYATEFGWHSADDDGSDGGAAVYRGPEYTNPRK